MRLSPFRGRVQGLRRPESRDHGGSPLLAEGSLDWKPSVPVDPALTLAGVPGGHSHQPFLTQSTVFACGSPPEAIPPPPLLGDTWQYVAIFSVVTSGEVLACGGPRVCAARTDVLESTIWPQRSIVPRLSSSDSWAPFANVQFKHGPVT